MEEVDRLKELEKALEEKWTGGPGGGYTPSNTLAQSLKAGSGGGTLSAVLGGRIGSERGREQGDDEEEPQDPEADMWKDLQELSNVEEDLVKRWRNTAVENDKKLRSKQNYAPPNAQGSQFLKNVPGKKSQSGVPVALR